MIKDLPVLKPKKILNDETRISNSYKELFEKVEQSNKHFENATIHDLDLYMLQEQMLRLDLPSLMALCSSDKTMRMICESEYMWKRKFQLDFPEDYDFLISKDNKFIQKGWKQLYFNKYNPFKAVFEAVIDKDLETIEYYMTNGIYKTKNFRKSTDRNGDPYFYLIAIEMINEPKVFKSILKDYLNEVAKYFNIEEVVNILCELYRVNSEQDDVLDAEMFINDIIEKFYWKPILNSKSRDSVIELLSCIEKYDISLQLMMSLFNIFNTASKYNRNSYITEMTNMILNKVNHVLIK